MFLSLLGALSAGEFRDIQCNIAQAGRFVAIYIDGPGILTVCELKVYGGKYLSRISEIGLSDF